ncbi:hypothetical protein GN157_00540 [Flavobacterium rakeshii]|uniref:Uncharacterized protein n=1 Tax=Flavobacterium rakeshii TaxID=1038845 RepID=A0A6N8H6A0_9FLAO|nr:hypothetical protein [Flavobacterium rakeshii]MUV02184.1 hypothetical protein [Flavobacterium rakeshii]
MVIRSKFTSYIYFPFLVLLPIGLIISINVTVGKENIPIEALIFFIISSAWILLSALLYEVRLRIIKVELNSREVLVRKFFGLGAEKKYRLKDLEGFHTFTRKTRKKNGFRSEIIEYDFIHLMYKGRIVARISNLYHSNYNEMAEFTKEHLTYLGYKKPNIFSEIKDALSF